MVQINPDVKLANVCFDCAFWRERFDAPDGYGSMGECRFNPPSFILGMTWDKNEEAFDQQMIASGWPITEALGWCSQHRAPLG